MTLPATTLEDKIRRRNTAINSITVYCKVEEGDCNLPSCKRGLTDTISTIVKVKKDTCPLVAAELLYQAFSIAIQSVYQEKKSKICFVCPGNQNLPMSKHTSSFSTPGDLSKHFRQKYLSNLEAGKDIIYTLCKILLQNKIHLQNYTISIYRTVL
jgi:hypothetical protein